MMHGWIYGVQGSGAEGLGYRARVIDSEFRKARLLLTCRSFLEIVGPHFAVRIRLGKDTLIF